MNFSGDLVELCAENLLVLNETHKIIPFHVQVELMQWRQQRMIEVGAADQMAHIENGFQRSSAMIVLRNLKKRAQHSVVNSHGAGGVDQCRKLLLDVAAENQR